MTLPTPTTSSLAPLGYTTEPVGPCCPLTDKPPDTWRAEVTASDDNHWNTNALRFGSRDDALEYAGNLARRWLLVTRWRAVDDSVPERQAYEDGSEDGKW